MKRYRVEVTQPMVYFVEAVTPEDASSIAIAWARSREIPEYSLEATANVDVIAETVRGV